VEELAVRAGAHLVDTRWLEVDKNATRDVLAGARFGKKCIECVVTTSDRLVGRHLPVRLNAMLKAVQFPACVAHLTKGGLATTAPIGNFQINAHLYSCLPDVNRHNFAHLRT
jgi:hypothetical protein